MKIRPLYDRILIKRLESKETEEGRNHHPRYRQGEADGGGGRRRRQGQGERGG